MSELLPASSRRSLRYRLVPAVALHQDGKVALPWPAESCPQIDLSHGTERGHTDLFVHPDYRGRFLGSGRHLTVGELVVKGAGRGLPEHVTDARHSSGTLGRTEALREYALGFLYGSHFSVRYHAVGRYVGGEYFLVRDGRVPRLGQVDARALDAGQRARLREFLCAENGSEDLQIIAQLMVARLFAPFAVNLTHHSVHMHNVNLLGQYLDLNSFGTHPTHVELAFWPHDGHLARLRALMGQLLACYQDLFCAPLRLEKVMTDVIATDRLRGAASVLLTACLQEDPLRQRVELSRHATAREAQGEVSFLIPSECRQSIDRNLFVFERQLGAADQDYGRFLNAIECMK